MREDIIRDKQVKGGIFFSRKTKQGVGFIVLGNIRGIVSEVGSQ